MGLARNARRYDTHCTFLDPFSREYTIVQSSTMARMAEVSDTVILEYYESFEMLAHHPDLLQMKSRDCNYLAARSLRL